MKTTLTALIVFGMLFVALPASAGGYGHGYRHGGHFYGHAYRHGGFGYRGYRGDPAQYLVGGVLLGALLAPPRYVIPPAVVYVPQPAPVVVTASAPARVAAGRRLLRDINGNCFERQIDASGREVRLPLPASECAW